MSLFSQIQKATNSIVPKLFSDPNLTKKVTWKHIVSVGYDSIAKSTKTIYDDYEVTVVSIEDVSAPQIGAARSLNQGPVQRFGQAMQANILTGSQGYLVLPKELPSAYSVKDLIVDGTEVYKITQIMPIFGLIVKVLVAGSAQ